MANVKDAREAAVAAFKKFDEYAKEHSIEDANELKGDKFSADTKTQFSALEKAAWDADAAFKTAEEQDTDGKRVMSARERLSFYSEAVTGRKMGFHPVYEEEAPKSLGRKFVDSDEYQDLVKSGVLKSDNASFRMSPIHMAATDVVTTGTGGVASDLVLPQYLPGVLPLPQRPITVRELFSNAPTGSDTISYAAQTAFDNAADTVAQAGKTGSPSGAKPQSSIAWERRTSPVETIATWMAATRQSLADAGQIQSLIDNQGRLMLQLVEEEQLIDGSGASPDLQGITATPGVQTLDLTGADNLDGIRVARRLVRTGISRLQADSIVLNPVDSEGFDLLKDDNRLYRGGNPVGNFTYNQPLWGLRRVESEAVDEGTAIVGAFNAGATVYERQGITVYTTDSHSDFFIKNLIAILFEERLGFAIFWPSAFVVVTLDPAMLGSGDIGVQT